MREVRMGLENTFFKRGGIPPPPQNPDEKRETNWIPCPSVRRTNESYPKIYLFFTSYKHFEP